jgi:hypothetical protein
VYPLLADCGGFELLLTKPKSRTDLQVVRCGSCSTEELRCLGTGRIYVRPIQKSLDVTQEEDESEEYEECLFCDKLFLIREIRQHITSCTVSKYNFTNTLVQSMFTFVEKIVDELPVHMYYMRRNVVNVVRQLSRLVSFAIKRQIKYLCGHNI